ncbi:class I SAM-dependent methyltransferase [Methylobacterium organophilum]|uniref:Ribosomal RNA small subunit methyltransferase C n=1 Tax=Methylobacterium organophilum TaxID=410 RepID=A0ABQ4T8L1_METOR|nr:class I SAM-dependent methyltransferase [Methylobacterium organophilum]GJE26422.1 Ribosomal RNA small subunit methyltransferase C [Methylobacterium organophilum]
MQHVVYGLPPAGLVEVASGAAQVSPFFPGSPRLEDVSPGSLDGAVVLAPAGTIERRYTLALALRGLAPGGRCVALAPKDRGGARLAKELAAFGAVIAEEARRHHRICLLSRPERPEGLEEAIAEGAPRHIDNMALCTQPGIFSWDRLDPGSALLIETLPMLSGRGADFGCGLGILSMAVLRSPAVTELAMIDIDRRAVAMAERNVGDARARFRWADLRQPDETLSRLDFVVMNPPFHDGGAEDRSLGQAFIARAAQVLRPGGSLWLTANTHLPYEATLREHFREVTQRAAGDGYKVIEARKATGSGKAFGKRNG